MISICYITCRREPRIEWFFDSLHRQLGGRYDGIQVVVVDLYAEAQREGWSAADAARRAALHRRRCRAPDLRVSAPHKNVWQGPGRRTPVDFFAKPCALNTAVMLAKHPYLLFVDDASVLSPGFLKTVEIHRAANALVGFAYSRRRNFVVQEGALVRSSEDPKHADHRRKYTSTPRADDGGWIYGCGVGVPLAAALAVDGWPLDACVSGVEDCLFGIAVKNQRRWPVVYDPRAVVIQSIDVRLDPVNARSRVPKFDPVVGGRHRTDVLLARVRGGLKRFDNGYIGGLAAARARVQRGEPLPARRTPTHDWFTGKPLEALER